jgi:hypothetical protein
MEVRGQLWMVLQIFRGFVCSICIPHQIKENEMSGACGTYGEEEMCIQGLVLKPKRKRPVERTRRRWGINIKMNLKDIGREVVEWIDLAQDKNK